MRLSFKEIIGKFHVSEKICYTDRSILTAKRTCKVCDLSSPLMYHGGTGCVRSIKDCSTAYRLRLVPLPYSSSPYSCDKIERFWKETNISFKREYVIWK